MKKLVISLFFLAVYLVGCDSKPTKRSFEYSDFTNSYYITSEKINGKKPSVNFSGDEMTIEIQNFPDTPNQTGHFKFLSPDESPSGKWTITKDFKLYFLIKSQSELLYRYYECDDEKYFVLHKKQPVR